MTNVAAVIVTHNSESVLDPCLRALQAQTTPPHTTVIVDSGSRSTTYLERAADEYDVQWSRQDNIGFSRANTIGFHLCPQAADAVFFLNPDTFVDRAVIERSIRLLQLYPALGCLTGRLLGYDIAKGTGTGRLDSTGIYRTWYGRWYDRGQGELDCGQYDRAEIIPAACGAFMFCRRTALEEVALPGGQIFAPDFFLYKEDIELSLRLRKKGWHIGYAPDVVAYHGRGWSRNRKEMPWELRCSAARNEVLLYRRHPSIYMLWALSKYLLVRGLKL